MVVVGINGGVRLGYQDIAAVLMVDGKLVAAVEEERINRIKHSPAQLSFLSIKEVLRIAGLRFEEVNIIATHGETWGNEFPTRLRDYFKFNFGSCPEIRIYHHHDCHAASAYFASGFSDSMLLSLDSSGDGISVQLSIGKQGRMKVAKRIARPDSFGIFYSLVTQFCGFLRDTDEYKLMGLSSYGNRTKFDFSSVIDYRTGELKLNSDYIKKIEPGQPQPTRQEKLFTEKFEKEFGNARIYGTPLSDVYKDIAASAQAHFEKILVALITDFHQETGLKNICLAGGVALNCAANQKIANLPFIENFFVQPVSSDAGISLGAAYLATVDEGISVQPMQDVYLGASYTNDEVKALLDKMNLRYKPLNDATSEAARLINEEKVIGWMNGRMEFGPRALGNRSILANPAADNIQQKVNQKIKFREGFRPFCPSVLEEDAPLYFEGKPTVSPYMTINFNATQLAKEKINGVIHVDGTARIQTVNRKRSPQYYSLLQNLKQYTGTGVVLNTSFNRNNEPIVCNPVDAVSSFFGCGLDYLIIEDFLVSKI